MKWLRKTIMPYNTRQSLGFGEPILNSDISKDMIIYEVFSSDNSGKSRVIGLIRVTVFESKRYAQIDAFSVHPDYRRKGVGKSMWNKVLDHLIKQNRVQEIIVSPHPYYDLPLRDNEKEPDEIPVEVLYEVYLSLGFAKISCHLDKTKWDQKLRYILQQM